MIGRARIAAILALFALLVCLRMPDIVLGGRFWAEEGTHFFLTAWQDPPLRATLLPFGGYLNLAASGATVLARWTLPLRLAPYGTIAVALLCQLLPPLLVLTATDAWLRPFRVRILSVLLILFSANSDEIWLQTLHCQFELTLAAALVLALDAPPLRSAAFAWRLVPLALAPLCGPGAFALVPLFFLRALSERSAPRLVSGAVIAAAALVQFVGFFSVLPGRTNALHPVLYLCMLTVRHLAVPLLGMAHAETIAGGIRAELKLSQFPAVAAFLPLVVFGTLGVAAVAAGRRQPALWLLAAAGAVSLLSAYGAISHGPDMVSAYFGERYVFVPQALLSLGVLALAATTDGSRAAVCRFAALWLLVIGASGYFFPWTAIAEGPDWQTEVASWRRDPSRPLHVWPAPMTIRLAPPPAAGSSPRA